VSYDEQPDGDPHGECVAEIRRLLEELAAAQAKIAELEAQNDLYRRAIEVLKNG
jgi:cell division protein FtsB